MRIILILGAVLAAILAGLLRPKLVGLRWRGDLGRNASPDGARAEGGSVRRDFHSMTKAELYEEAKRLGIPARSRMDKDQLIRALAARARPRRS